MKCAVKVLITGAAGRIGYSLIPMVCMGKAFGPDQPVELLLLDLESTLPVLKGISFEIEDCASPLLKSVSYTSDQEKAFTDIDFAILVGAFPRKRGMERKDLLEKNRDIFVHQGGLLERFAKKTVKVVVVGNPANTNCYICSQNAPSIPKENFTCLLRLDQNRALSQAAKAIGSVPSAVSDVFVLGNHSATQVPCVRHGKIESSDGSLSLFEKLKSTCWNEEDFMKVIQQRGAEIIKYLGASSAMSAANAICDHLHDWLCGSEKICTMGVASDGSFNVPLGLFSGFPVKCHGAGKYEIVKDFELDSVISSKLEQSVKELQDEIAAICTT